MATVVVRVTGSFPPVRLEADRLTWRNPLATSTVIPAYMTAFAECVP